MAGIAGDVRVDALSQSLRLCTRLGLGPLEVELESLGVLLCPGLVGHGGRHLGLELCHLALCTVHPCTPQDRHRGQRQLANWDDASRHMLYINIEGYRGVGRPAAHCV